MVAKDIEFSLSGGVDEEMLFACIDSLTKTMSGSVYTWQATVTCNTRDTGLHGRLRARHPDVSVFYSESQDGIADHVRTLRLTRARYVWLLKDTILVLPDAIRRVIEFLDRPESARVGLAAPQQLDPDGNVQRSGHDFPTMGQILLDHSGLRQFPLVDSFIGRLAPPRVALRETRKNQTAFEVETLNGACVVARTKAVRQVGPMLDSKAVGGAEIEWHRRFHEHGWTVLCYPEASVINYGGQAAGYSGRYRGLPDLERVLPFIRTGQGRLLYSLFCSALLAVFGVRTAVGLFTRKRTQAAAAQRYGAAVWNDLKSAWTATSFAGPSSP